MACRIDRIDFEEIAIGHVGEDHIDHMREHGWDVLPSGLTVAFRKDWNLWHSFREFAQNALDEMGAVDVEVLRRSDAPPVTLLRDDGKGFAVQALLLGEQKGTDERQKHCLRGRFGEGMKIGVLPILRAGGRILIRTVDVDVTWQDGIVKLAGQRLRGVLTMTRPNRNTDGTCVAIEGLDAEHYLIPGSDQEQDLRMRLAPFIAERRPDLVLHTVTGGPGEYGDCKVRQMFRLPGAIFVRDIFVEHRDRALFGYNFWFDDSTAALDPNRDRITAEPWSDKLKGEFAVLLRAMPSAVLEKLVDGLLVLRKESDVQARVKRDSFEWKVLDAMDLAEAEVGVLRTLHGIVVARLGTDQFSFADGDRDRKVLEHAGMVNLDGRLPDSLGRAFAAAGLMKTPGAIAGSVGQSTVPLSDLRVRGFLEIVAVEAGDVKRLFDRWRFVRRRVEELASALVSERVTTHFYVGTGEDEERKWAGFAKQNEREIHLRVSTVVGGHVVETLVHEAAHLRSHASDLTDSFEHALVTTGGRLCEIQRSRPQWYDRLVKELEALRGDTFTAARVVGKLTVDGTQTATKSLPEALDEDGFRFFAAGATRLEGASLGGMARAALSSRP